jgi:hypothetical protein
MTTTTTPLAQTLHLKIDADGSLKIGTCEHCVIQELGRPNRAWDPDGDRELDFDRDTLIQQLGELGVQVTITQEYVCP